MGRLFKGGIDEAQFVPPDINSISIDDLLPTVGVDGRLATPIVIEKNTRVDLGSIRNYPEMGDTRFEIVVQGIPSVNDGPDRGLTLLWSQEEVSYQSEYGFPLHPCYEGTESVYIPLIMVTQTGAFVHDPRKTYAPRFIHDYDRVYDFYPFDNPVPFGDPSVEWTIAVMRSDAAGVATFTITIAYTDSESVTHTYSIALFTLASGAIVESFMLGEGWRFSDNPPYPVNMELRGSLIFFLENSGVLPTIDTFTIPAAVSPSSLGYWEVPVAATASVGAPHTVEGFRLSLSGAPTPLPLEGVFVALPAAATFVAAYGNPPVQTGAHTFYLWAVSETGDVSLRASGNTFLCDVLIDGVTGGGYFPTVQYTVGQTAIVGGGVLSMRTPNGGDAITFAIAPAPSGGDDGTLFEIVGGVLQFIDPAVVPPHNGGYHDQDSYTVYVTAEDEHGNTSMTYIVVSPQPAP